MIVAEKWENLQDALERFAGAGERAALVPTMGALHAGHLSLVELAKTKAERVVVSIFVNPTQFGPNEDYHRYPRRFAEDKALLEQAGVDVIYAPAAEELYREGHSSTISVGALSRELCGAARPGHFDGVCTIVAKLFNRVMPDVAVFGEKDYQQLTILRKMALELDFMVEILGAPTLREADGLAMSSRNAYLSAEQRQTAAALYAALMQVAEAIRHGTSAEHAIANAEQQLLQAGFAKVDYIALCDAETLAPVASLGKPARLLAAAWLGTTRLIDNIAL